MKSSRLPPVWPEKTKQPRLIAAMESLETFTPKVTEIEAFAVLKDLPDELRMALLAELKLGNVLTQVDRADWPNAGSIFICLQKRFNLSTRELSPEVKWVNRNDRYWWEDLSQIKDGVTHLVVC
jgi:hypothetical protein